MKNKVLFLLILLLPLMFFSQEKNILQGQLIGKNIDLSFIHIINKTTKKVTYTNPNGTFKIAVKKGDSLFVSAIHITNKYFIITQNTINTQKIIIQLKEESNSLKEVVIKNHTLTGSLSFDAYKSPNKDSLLLKNGVLNFSVAYDLSKPLKPDALSKDKSITRSLSQTDPTRAKGIVSIDAFATISLITNLFTNKEKQKERARIRRKNRIKNQKIANLNIEDRVEYKLLYLFGKEFFTTELGIPEHRISDFVNYCKEQTNLAMLIVNKNEIKLIDILINESKKYNELLKSE